MSGSLTLLLAQTDLSFEQLFALLRERAGLSARSLSLQAGLSPSYVAKLERGDVVPSIESFAVLVSALGASDAEIVGLVRRRATSSQKTSIV